MKITKMKQLAIAVLMLAGLQASAQSKKFDVTIRGCEKDTVYLVRYYGQKMFYADTAIADANGKVSFDPSIKSEAGMYAVMPDDKSGYFEILVSDEDIVIETDKRNYVGSMKIVKSAENKAFYEYIRFISAKQKQAAPLKEQLSDSTLAEEKKESLRASITKMDEEVKAEQQRVIKDNAGSLVSLVMRLSTDIDVPQIKEENGELDKAAQRNYYVSHFWDGIDLADDRLMRMAGYEKKLEYFFDKILIQQKDTIILQAEKMIRRTTEGTEPFKFLVVWLTSHFQNSKIMCLDGVFVHMVLNYYRTGKSFWMPEDKNKEIVERAEAMAPNVCGAMAHNISLPDTTEENWVKLSDIEAKYRILVFWDPDCGHCKKELPKFVENYAEWKKLGADVYAVSSSNNDEWRAFIKEKGLPWTNVAVPEKVYKEQSYVNEVVMTKKTDLESLNYHDTFDIFKTPTVYVIGEDGRIIGKNLESEGISDYLRRLNDQPK